MAEDRLKLNTLNGEWVDLGEVRDFQLGLRKKVPRVQIESAELVEQWDDKFTRERIFQVRVPLKNAEKGDLAWVKAVIQALDNLARAVWDDYQRKQHK